MELGGLTALKSCTTLGLKTHYCGDADTRSIYQRNCWIIWKQDRALLSHTVLYTHSLWLPLLFKGLAVQTDEAKKIIFLRNKQRNLEPIYNTCKRRVCRCHCRTGWAPISDRSGLYSTDTGPSLHSGRNTLSGLGLEKRHTMQRQKQWSLQILYISRCWDNICECWGYL